MGLFGILCEVEKKFNKSDVMDKRIKKKFIEEVLPASPPLTDAEEDLLDRVARLEETLAQKGKRIKGNLKEDIHKFLWRENDLDWAGYTGIFDVSAEGETYRSWWGMESKKERPIFNPHHPKLQQSRIC